MLVKCYRCGEVFDVPEPVPETFTCPRCHSALTLAEGGVSTAVAIAVPVITAVASAISTAFIMKRFPPRKERRIEDIRDMYASIIVAGFFGIIAYLATRPRG